MQNKATSDSVKKELEQVLARLDGFDNTEIDAVITKYAFKSPIGNEVTKSVPFNLMFPSQIGPTGNFRAFLRPETAQGIFINFKRLLEFNQVSIIVANKKEMQCFLGKTTVCGRSNRHRISQ